MKKIVFTGITILIALLFVTCDSGLPEDESIVGYTDVVYSADGTEVTVYLDGVGVPVTKASRAMSLDLAKKAYDYLEVIFDSTSVGALGGIARSAWELGQSAGISGVYRTAAPVGIIYGTTYSTSANMAALFVGTKRDKTLLGIGTLIRIDDTPYGTSAGQTNSISLDTTSVTFGISSIKSQINATNVTGAFNFTGATSVSSPDTAADWDSNTKKVTNTPLGSTTYPVYALPVTEGGKATATYAFTNANAGLIRYDITPDRVNLIQIRIPRYLDNGRYFELKSNFNTGSSVAFDSSFTTSATDGNAFIPNVPLTFETRGKGSFSFYMEFPVYGINKSLSTNGGPKYTPWYVRTGFGSELYSMDDGVGAGGCITMSIGLTALDWIEIYWNWSN